MTGFRLGEGSNAESRRPRVRGWLVPLVIAAAIVVSDSAGAQSTNGPGLRLGVGAFLSRDRGWNYDQQVEVFGAITNNVGSFSIEAGGSFYKSFGSFSYPAVSPRPSTAFRNGFAGRVQLRTPTAERALSAIVGAEVFHNLTDGEPRATTAAGTAGIGVNFGSARRGSLDLRYVRFAKRLGSSSGILPLTLTWRL